MFHAKHYITRKEYNMDKYERYKEMQEISYKFEERIQNAKSIKLYSVFIHGDENTDLYFCDIEYVNAYGYNRIYKNVTLEALTNFVETLEKRKPLN